MSKFRGILRGHPLWVPKKRIQISGRPQEIAPAKQRAIDNRPYKIIINY